MEEKQKDKILFQGKRNNAQCEGVGMVTHLKGRRPESEGAGNTLQ